MKQPAILGAKLVPMSGLAGRFNLPQLFVLVHMATLIIGIDGKHLSAHTREETREAVSAAEGGAGQHLGWPANPKGRALS